MKPLNVEVSFDDYRNRARIEEMLTRTVVDEIRKLKQENAALRKERVIAQEKHRQLLIAGRKRK